MTAGDKLLILLFHVTLLAGRFSLDRIDPAYASLGVLAEVRYALVALMGVLTFIRWTREPIPLTEAQRWALAVGVLYGYLALSAAWAPSTTLAIDDMLQALLTGAIVVMIPVYLARATREAIAFFMVLSFWTAVAYAIGGLLGIGQLQENRMSAFSGGANVFVRVMVTGTFAAFFLETRTGSRAWLFGVPAFVVCAILSGSRGGLLAFIAAAAGFLFAMRRTALRPGRWALFGATITIITVAFPEFIGRVRHFWQQRFIEITFEEGYTSDRDLIFRAAWRLFLDHPVQGAGISGFFQRVGRYNDWDYTHNIVLSVASEGGLIGLALLAIPLIWVSARTLRAGSAEVVTCFWSGTFYLLASLFSGTYYDGRMIWVFFAMALLAREQESREPAESTPPLMEASAAQ